MKKFKKLLFSLFFVLLISDCYALTPEAKVAIDNYLKAKHTFAVESGALQSGINFEQISSVFYHFEYDRDGKIGCYMNGIRYITFDEPQCATLRDHFGNFLISKKNLLNMSVTDPDLRAILDSLVR